MKFFVTVILFFSVLCSVSFADRFVLVMSKDDPVCQKLYRIYNADLEKYGVFTPENHTEFTAVQWKEFTWLEIPRQLKDRQFFYAIYDVNNDGKDEFVMKWGGELPAIHILGIVIPMTSLIFTTLISSWL